MASPGKVQVLGGGGMYVRHARCERFSVFCVNLTCAKLALISESTCFCLIAVFVVVAAAVVVVVAAVFVVVATAVVVVIVIVVAAGAIVVVAINSYCSRCRYCLLLLL